MTKSGSESPGLQVTVTGDLPRDELERIASVVRRAAMEEVAKIDLRGTPKETTESVVRDSLSRDLGPVLGYWINWVSGETSP